MLNFIDFIMVFGPVIWCRIFAVFLPWFLRYLQKSAVFFCHFLPWFSTVPTEDWRAWEWLPLVGTTTVKLRVEAGSRINAGSRIQAGGVNVICTDRSQVSVTSRVPDTGLVPNTGQGNHVLLTIETHCNYKNGLSLSCQQALIIFLKQLF